MQKLFHDCINMSYFYNNYIMDFCNIFKDVTYLMLNFLGNNSVYSDFQKCCRMSRKLRIIS